MNKSIFTIVLVISSQFSFSQGVPSAGGAGAASDSTSEKRIDFMAVPYLNYSRSLGAAIGAVPMAMYKVNPNDTISPASMTGMVGMYTTNKTWFGMMFQQLYLREDSWRVTAAMGLGSVNFQFYLDGVPGGVLDYNTRADFVMVEVQRKLIEDLYLGFHYQWVKTKTDFKDTDFEQENILNGYGLSLAYDHRDDVYYPREGSLNNIKWTSFPEFLANDYSSDKIEIYRNQYISSRENKDVIALRAYGGFGVGEVAFEQQFVVGQVDIRGYSQGEYRGDQTAAIQGEYRWNFHEKMSAVGFLGLASVWGSANEEDNGSWLPGGGAGFRYNVFPKYHMNVGLDAAVGKEDWGVYFRIGEAF
ncbi:MAG: BamA/TamA family outer membrane protein [Reichenbachiella sp.]